YPSTGQAQCGCPTTHSHRQDQLDPLGSTHLNSHTLVLLIAPPVSVPCAWLKQPRATPPKPPQRRACRRNLAPCDALPKNSDLAVGGVIYPKQAISIASRQCRLAGGSFVVGPIHAGSPSPTAPGK